MEPEVTTMKQKEFFYSVLVCKFYNVNVTDIDVFSNLKIRSLNMKLQTKGHTRLNLNTYKLIKKFCMDKTTEKTVIKSVFEDEKVLVRDNRDRKGTLIGLLSNMSYHKNSARR